MHDASEDSAITDIFRPTDSEGEPLSWDGNNAKILGLLQACGKHYKKVGILQPFFAHRSVLLSNGKIAVPSKASIPFLDGTIEDSYDFDRCGGAPTVR